MCRHQRLDHRCPACRSDLTGNWNHKDTDNTSSSAAQLPGQRENPSRRRGVNRTTEFESKESTTIPLGLLMII